MYEENYEMVSASIGISVKELESLKSPEELEETIALYSQCAVECLFDLIGQRYPHLVGNE